ncbi:hypothetical protein QJS66_23425 (plasmid) [Kocuria rhizophila]|nr:hypothetical protein QJS66_23425 [Kocuria rhizophila]
MSTREQAASLDTARRPDGHANVLARTRSAARASTCPGLDAARSHLHVLAGRAGGPPARNRLGRSMRDTDYRRRRAHTEWCAPGAAGHGPGHQHQRRPADGRIRLLAQQELETIQERTRVGLEHARAQGREVAAPQLNPAQRAGRAGRAAWWAVRVRGRHPARASWWTITLATRHNLYGESHPRRAPPVMLGTSPDRLGTWRAPSALACAKARRVLDRVRRT